MELRESAALGIIPACAGSTSESLQYRRKTRDHPRMRGEHNDSSSLRTVDPGSSPHARGAPRWPCRCPSPRGIIPACAGSTPWHSRVSARGRDHPRMRGEHRRARAGGSSCAGSSPHARGALDTYPALPKLEGIIPACAGSTSPRSYSRPLFGDHPRMRGEHCSKWLITTPPGGSSPHARGAQLRDYIISHRRGIIPACAGSTFAVPFVINACRDHPRMRGEHSLKLDDGTRKTGSSPHARGAQLVAHLAHRHDGIIPACAGSTRPRTRCTRIPRDHPRMRGEHLARQCELNTCKGSSPHARGAPLVHAHLASGQGIIPACAGSTGRF